MLTKKGVLLMPTTVLRKRKTFSYQGRNLKLFLCVCKRFQFSLLQKCLKHPAWQQQGCQKKQTSTDSNTDIF